MRRAIVRPIARRAVWTLVYIAGVFLLVGALAYFEWRFEMKLRARR